jgi:hypothetical protein
VNSILVDSPVSYVKKYYMEWLVNKGNILSWKYFFVVFKFLLSWCEYLRRVNKGNVLLRKHTFFIHKIPLESVVSISGAVEKPCTSCVVN